MLYALHEWHRRMLNPMSAWADAASRALTHPYSPFAYSPISRRLAAGYDLLHRLGKRYEKPVFGLNTTLVDGVEVPVVEELPLVKPFCQLRHFRRMLPPDLAARRKDPTLLVFAPLSGHHATLLRDTVRALLPLADIHVTDWIDARQVPLSHGPFHLDDYVDYAIEFIRFLGPKVHLISVCQPTVPVLGAVALMATAGDPALPRTMTMMGGPIDTRRNPTQVNALAQRKSYDWFRNHVIHKVPSNYPGYLREVYPGFLQHAGFVAMNPDRHMESHWDYYLDMVKGDLEDAEGHRRFYDEYNAVIDLPAEYYLDTIKTVFQDHALPEGKWLVRGQRVAPEDIKGVGLFTIEGELDDISGSGQTQAALELCRGLQPQEKQHLMAKDVGHYGIFSGRRWRENIAPKIMEFVHRYERA